MAKRRLARPARVARCPACGTGKLERETTVKGRTTTVRWRCKNCDAVIARRKRQAS